MFRYDIAQRKNYVISLGQQSRMTESDGTNTANTDPVQFVINVHIFRLFIHAGIVQRVTSRPIANENRKCRSLSKLYLLPTHDRALVPLRNEEFASRAGRVEYP